MSGAVLVWGIGAFVIALAAHIVWWRVRRPRSDIAALLLVLLVAPVTLCIGLWYRSRPFDGVDLLAALLLHVSLASAYIQTYPAAQAASPSLQILLGLGARRADGLTLDELSAHFSQDHLVGARLDDLLANKLVRPVEGGYALSASATALVRFFVAFRALLGLREKGG